MVFISQKDKSACSIFEFKGHKQISAFKIGRKRHGIEQCGRSGGRVDSNFITEFTLTLIVHRCELLQSSSTQWRAGVACLGALTTYRCLLVISSTRTGPLPLLLAFRLCSPYFICLPLMSVPFHPFCQTYYLRTCAAVFLIAILPITEQIIVIMVR